MRWEPEALRGSSPPAYEGHVRIKQLTPNEESAIRARN